MSLIAFFQVFSLLLSIYLFYGMLFFPVRGISLGLIDNTIYFCINQTSSVNSIRVNCILSKTRNGFKLFKVFNISFRMLYSSISLWVSLTLILKANRLFSIIIRELAICCSNNCWSTENCKFWKSSCLPARWLVISAKQLRDCVNCDSFSLISLTWSSIVFNSLVKSFCTFSSCSLTSSMNIFY